MNNFSLEQFLNHKLNINKYKDYTVNGLQIQGKDEVKKIVTGVTASQELIDYAISVGANAILVHHGYFWKGSDPRLVGYHYERIKKLITHNINLYAYHLPLDGNAEFGNNVELAKLFDLNHYEFDQENELLLICTSDKPIYAEDFALTLAEKLGNEVLHLNKNCPAYITKIGICSGGGQGFIDQAKAAGCDAYISGEISEYTYHSSVEQGIHYFQIGHHVSERYGIKRLGEIVATELGLEVEFKDIHNPA